MKTQFMPFVVLGIALCLIASRCDESDSVGAKPGAPGASGDADTDTDSDTDTGSDADGDTDSDDAECKKERLISGFGGMGWDVAFDGEHGMFLGETGLYIYDLQDLSDPKQLSWLREVSKARAMVQLEENRWLIDAGDIHLVDTADPEAPTVLSTFPLNNGFGNKMGIHKGHAVFVASNGGIQIVDYQDPQNPQPVGFMESGMRVENVAISGDYLLIAGYNSNAFAVGIKIVDLTDSTAPVETSFGEMTLDFSGFAVKGDIAYGTSMFGEIYILDISDPLLPVPIGSVESNAAGLVIKGNLLIGIGNCLEIYDITDPTNLVMVSAAQSDAHITGVALRDDTLLLAGLEYGFEGRDISTPTDHQQLFILPALSVNAFAVVENYLFIPNPSEHFTVINLDTPDSPSLVGLLETSGPVYDVMAFQNLLVYVVDSELEVMDVSNPTAPKVVSTTAIGEGTGWLMEMKDDILVLVDRMGTVQLVDLSDSGQPVILGSTKTQAGAIKIAVNDSHIALECEYWKDIGQNEWDSVTGLWMVDISDVMAPQDLGEVFKSWNPCGIAIQANYLFAIRGHEGFVTYDISDPEAPEKVKTTPLGDGPSTGGGITIYSNYAFVASAGILYILDISQPEAPTVVDQISSIDYAFKTAIHGENLIIGGPGLMIARHCM